MSDYFVVVVVLCMGAMAGIAGGLLGIGGGAVLVPMLLALFFAIGIDGVSLMHLAVATSLASIVFTGISSTLAHHRRNSVDWSVVVRLTPGLMVGAALAGALGALIDENWLQGIFGIFLIVIGTRLLIPPSGEDAPQIKTSSRIVFASATAIGLFSALVGIGGGSLTVPLLRRLGRRMQMAVGSASACGVPLALGGTLGWMLPGWQAVHPWAMGYVLLPVALLLGLGATGGAFIGAHLAHRLPANTLQIVFAVVVIGIGLYLLLALAPW